MTAEVCLPSFLASLVVSTMTQLIVTSYPILAVGYSKRLALLIGGRQARLLRSGCMVFPVLARASSAQ